MAKLLAKSMVLPVPREDWVEDKALNDLYARMDSLPPGEIVGVIMEFQVADNYARYLVTKEKPLTLQHLDYCDGYQISVAHVRGIRKGDVLDQVKRREFWRSLKSAKGGK